MCYILSLFYTYILRVHSSGLSCSNTRPPHQPVWPHYVPNKDGDGKTLHLLVHGWRDGKFAVLKHETGGHRE